MNVQLLIEKIGNLDKLYGEKFYVALDDILDLVKQLDEPGKVTVPQFVADWIKKYDLREETLGKQSVFDVFDNLENDSKNGYYKNENYWIFSNKDENTLYQTHHTRKELEEAGFGEVFNSPLFEVEEVE